MSQEVSAHMAYNSPGIGIVASAGRKAHDYTNGLALVKLFTQSYGRSTNKKGKANGKFN